MMTKVRSHPAARRPILRAAFGSTALAALTLWTLALPAAADAPRCDEALVPQPEECRRANVDVVVAMPMGENTEVLDAPAGSGFDALGFSISIDNRTVAGAPAPKVPQRNADLAAAGDDVQVRFDGLDLRPILNVSTADLRAAYRAGEAIRFRASSNYPAFIARAEIRVLDRSRRGAPVVATIPIQPNGEAAWAMPSGGDGKYAYVLRVYDARGRYDETRALDLDRTTAAYQTHAMTGPVIAAGEGEDRTRLRRVPLSGGTVTANGTGLAGRKTVRVMGEEVPVDASGRFVVQRILPAGEHSVTIDAGGRPITREVSIPAAEWFYVAIADITAGKRLRDDLAEAAGDYEDTYVDGRLAFYLKGKVQGKYLVTSSLDTGEGPLDEMFSRLDEKDPRRVLARLDPDDFYPVYGDDSSAYDDTPTSGRFYVRVERDSSYAMWGDFKAGLSGAEFLRNDRALYGAKLHFATPSTTSGGDPRLSATLYAAQPETLPQRDILRGTGGSVFFLSRQDINAASESLSIQLRDPDTGRIVETRRLVAGVDYEIDYMQGVVILREPLPSSASGGTLISDGGSGALDVNLVAQYEYTPLTGSLDGASLGGRLEFWPSDRLRVGVTAMRETTGPADQRMVGADLHWDLGENSFIEAEIAESDGPGFGRSLSTDGGLTLTPDGAPASGKARAYRFDGQFDLAELGAGVPGQVRLYYEMKQAGFSTINEDITQDQRLWGLSADVDLSDRLSLGVTVEDFERDGGDTKKTAEVRLKYALNEVWSVEAGVARLDKFTFGDPDETGTRTDAAIRVNYRPGDDLLLYGFGQMTLDVSGGIGENDRYGLGIDARLSEKVSVQAEASDGDKGVGAKVRLTYSPTADNEIYIGYTLDPTRTGAGYDLVGTDDGTVVVGGRFRQTDKLLTWGENSWDMFGARRSLTRGYGVTYTPDARWTFSAGYESGEVRDEVNGDFDRTAISLGAAYAADDAVKGRARLEYRTEDGDGTAQDRVTWGFSGGYEVKVSDDWRFLANVDALYSESAEGDFRDGEYVEASLGYAYRPIDNDRLNLLMKYTYLRDLPGEDQVTADGSTDGPLQVSHVLSIDGNYDISPKLTFGAKYGYRCSQVAPRGTDTFTDSTAHLAIVRVDWHVVHKWDILAEARTLHTTETDITEQGALLAVYRHLGNNAKLGLGYEWGKVSDNPTNLDYLGRGVFLNLIAKF